MVRMKDSESVIDYAGRLMGLVNQARLLGEPFPYHKKAFKKGNTNSSSKRGYFPVCNVCKKTVKRRERQACL